MGRRTGWVWIAASLALLAAPAWAAPEAEPWQAHQKAAAAAIQQDDFATAKAELVAAFGEAARFSASDRRLARLFELIHGYRGHLLRLGRPVEADALADAIVERAVATRGPDHPVTLELQRGLAATDLHARRWAEAAPRLVELKERAARALGIGDARAIRASAMLAEVLLETDRLDEAWAMADAARREARQSLGVRHPELAQPVAVMVLVELRRGRFEEALALAEEAAATDEPEGLKVADAFVKVAAVLRSARRAEDALPWNERAVDLLQRQYGKDSLPRMYGLTELVLTKLALGSRVDAHRLLQPIMAIARASDHAFAGLALTTAARVEMSLGRYDEALPLAREAVTRLRSVPGGGEALLNARRQVASIEGQRGNLELARGLQEDVLLRTGILHGARSAEYAAALNDLAYFEAQLGNAERADARMAQSLEIDPFDPEGDASRRDTLGLIRLRQGRVEEAIELFEGALARMPAEAPYRIATLEPLHEALQAAGREARAAEIAAELAETRLRDEKAIASLGLDDGIFVSEEFNFRLEDPPAGWHDLDVSAVNPAAIVGLRRSGPEVFFTIVPTVQEVPGVSLESLGRALRVSLESRTHELYLASEERRTLAGMDGWLIEASGRRDDHRFDWLLWVTVQNGVTYQFLLWAQEGRLARSALRTDLEAFAGRFSLLDPARHFGPVVEYLAALESDRFGFRLPLAEGRWVAWNDLPEQADAGAMAGSDAALIVASVSYLGRSVAPREAAEALLAVFDHELPAGAVRTSEADVSEFRFDAERPMEGDLFEYRVRVLASSSAAWLAMAWKRKGTDPGVLEAVDGFDVSPASLTVRSEADLAPSDRARHAAFFNVVGVSRFARGQGGGAIEDLRLSATLAPEAQTLENLTHVLLAAGRSAEAAEILAAHTEAVEARPQLRAYRALARGRAGETEAAIEEYRTAFDAGYESDEFFEDYVQLVWASGDEAGALTALDDEIARTRSVRLRRLRAVFRQREGEADAAIEELAALAAASPGDIEGLYLLVNASLDAGRYSEALEVFDRIEAIEGRTNAGQRGRASALLGLGRYREAKEALEVAVALEPASAETREELDQVAAMLGTGSNLALKTPIDPVPERPGAPSPHELPASALDGAGAYWTLRSVAVAYRPGVEHRRTVREIVRIVDPTGVDTMSTLRIGFHPLAEEVFVNLLEVRDAAGEPVARGDVSEFYVLDDVSDMATSDKVAHLPVPGLAPGRTIHLTYTVRSRVAPEQFPLLEETFSRTLPVARAEVFVRADPAALRWTASPDVREERFEGGVAWSVDRPPAYRWEPFQTSYRSFLPWLLVGERASSWSREGAGYLQDIAERLEPDASLAAVARREIAGAQTADEKARRLDAFARRHLTYQAIEFGQRARVPNAVPDILERRYGDCKDHALLLHQLLGHVGVRSHLTLVNLTAPIVESVPSLDQFDHMIVHCSDCTQSRFLDPTNKHWSASDESPLYLAGRAGLVLDEEEPRLVRLAGYRAEHHFVETERELTPDGKGNAVVRERVRMGGYAAALLRGLLSGIEPPSWKEAIQSAYLRGIGSLTLQHLRVEGLNESSGPLELEMGYEIDRAFHRMDRGWVGRIPAPWERAFLGAESVDERLAPFEFEFPVSLRSRIQIAGGRPATLFGEREASGDGPFGRWRATVRESGAIEVHWELERAEGRYPASEYRAFVEEANRSLAAVSRSIRLEAEVSAR